MNEISEEILKKFVAGDGDSKKIIYETFYQKMYMICLRYAGDRDEAKDMLHDGFVKLFNKTSQVDSVTNFEGWIKKLFTNHCIDYLRSAYKRYIKYEPDFDENLMEEEVKETDNSHFNVTGQYSLNELTAAMNLLKPDYRVIINMYAIEQYSHQQISDTLGILASTSRSKLMRARVSLKKILLSKKK